MSMAARISLFVLASLTLVIVPAVMFDTYETIVNATHQEQPILAAIGIIPLGIVLLGCVIAMIMSIFRVKAPPSNS